MGGFCLGRRFDGGAARDARGARPLDARKALLRRIIEAIQDAGELAAARFAGIAARLAARRHAGLTASRIPSASKGSLCIDE